jgi:hypothetical protein
MPAHHTKIIVDEKVLLRQRVLVFLLTNGFLLLDSNMDISKEEYDYVLVRDGVAANQKLDNLNHGIDSIDALARDLGKYCNSLGRIKLDCNWNYLGQNQEREEYIRYLTTVFWQNQTEERLQELYNYSELVEFPHKIINYPNIIENIKIPADFFSQKTNDFVIKISDILSKWSLNPYLILVPEANFQWSISISGEKIVYGYTNKKENGDIWQKYFFKLF